MDGHMKNKDGKFTILVVDDEKELRELIAESLSLRGYSVLLASGGIEALEIAKKESVDVIVSDVRMPKGDGIMLLRELKKCQVPAPIIMMSGFADITGEDAIKLGAVD